MNKDTILGIVRHGLTFGGGLLAQKGLLTGDDATALVSAIVTIIGVVWSIMAKRKAAPSAN